MRSEEDVINFEQEVRRRYAYNCKKCNGTDHSCECHIKCEIQKRAYEACIPKDFWNIKAKNVSHNKPVFRKTILKYSKKITEALRGGFGLVLLGNNGVGKSYFLSYVLMRAIRKGYSTYYTTLLTLAHNMKRGWKDPKIEQRLEWLFTSDFLAIDEIGKGRHKGLKKDEATFMDTEIERILKDRFDNSRPVLIASNMQFIELLEVYGPTVESMLMSKFKVAQLEDGDCRKQLAAEMKNKMGY
jgi:DNA replication protein DnaC